ncbi:16S rRNA (cytidine(1402)-2'-O)-methyltransferase [Candidatus Dojkabacteria bacterium]|nr:16S rRNA (cytidine(1402)-2'-O)-methyltransferase [Candidatus Dojkabacteria bacterium]
MDENFTNIKQIQQNSADTSLNISEKQLFVVATPIGNLKDITVRAIDTLKNSDIILSEDTRKTSILLQKYDIKTKLLSYRDQNHDRVFSQILNEINNNKVVSLVSDGGTPLISDPGYKLVSELSSLGIRITPIPGPSALVCALSVSGLPTDKFTFLGFLPKGPNRRVNMLKDYENLDTTLVIYESPKRIRKLMVQIEQALGNRFVCIAHEMTKIHENFIKGFVRGFNEKSESLLEKGEYVVMIAKSGYTPKDQIA